MKYIFWGFIAIVIYTYFGYPLILTIVSIFRKNKSINQHEPNNRFQPFVSLIIAAHNEEKVIRQKIENSLAIDYPENRFEIILVSDGSTDNTNQIIKQVQNDRLKCICYKPRRGKAYAINLATKEACGEIIVYSDANVWYEKDAIQNLVRHFRAPAIGCVCGEVRLYTADETTTQGEGLYSMYERFIQRKESIVSTMVAIDGAMFAIRKSLFKPIPEDTIVEDFYLALNCIEQQYRIIHVSDAKGEEEAAVSIQEEVRRKKRMIAGGFQTLARMKWLLNPFHNPVVSFEFISHKLLRWLLPFFLILIFIANTAILGVDNLNFYKFIYLFILISQLLFYGCAVLGFISKNTLNNKVIYFCTYFCAVNIAALIGLYRFFFRQQKVTWEKITR